MNGKKMICRFFPLLFALLLFSGCSRKSETTTKTEYKIYYKNVSENSLAEVSYEPSAQTFDEMMTELLAQLAAAPVESAYESVLPESVQVLGYERGIDALRIDFSKEYYEMDNITEVLLRAAVVKTISCIPGVTKIMITVESEQLVDEDGNPVAAMDSESFIDSGDEGINSYQTATLVLYFPNQKGTLLKKEVRTQSYSSNMVLEKVIVDALLKGPDTSGCKSILNASTEILDISTKDGICTINFSAEFNQKLTENAPSAQAALYALVNALCETSDKVEGVKITVEGQSTNIKFWDEIDLDQIFYMNEALIETEQLETE